MIPYKDRQTKPVDCLPSFQRLWVQAGETTPLVGTDKTKLAPAEATKQCDFKAWQIKECIDNKQLYPFKHLSRSVLFHSVAFDIPEIECHA